MKKVMKVEFYEEVLGVIITKNMEHVNTKTSLWHILYKSIYTSFHRLTARNT